jgi:adenosylmethionine-8-amino-7-oxononanoate aminotransferase
VAQLNAAYKKYTIVYVELEAVTSENLARLDPTVYIRIRNWCTANGVSLVVDEVLSALATNHRPLAHHSLITTESHRPDFVIVGKLIGTAALLCTSQAKQTLSLTQEGFETWCKSVRDGRTVIADSSALLRSAILMEWCVQHAISERAQATTEALPRILKELQLPLPAWGSGFLWKFKPEQIEAMPGWMVAVLDCRCRLRLYLDMCPWDVQ